MTTCLITGGAGFFGKILKQRALARGFQCVSVDLEADEDTHPRLISIQGDIRDSALMEKLFAEHRFETVYHCAAILAHTKVQRDYLWSCNVDGTRVIAGLAEKYQVRHAVFLSSNCLWAKNFGRPVRENDAPEPVEIYGRSKWEGEKIFQSYGNSFPTAIIRCPTIMDEGRLGLLSILFEFIDEGRKLWLVGDGSNRYQFIYAQDLASACIMATEKKAEGVFNIGSDDVKSFRKVYQYVLDHVKTGARLAHLPKGPALWGMRLGHGLGLSPLGPYQYKMIAEDFLFDTSKIKDKLGWRPTLNNEEMLLKAYEYYRRNKRDIFSRKNVSAHRQAAKMGIIRLLKWAS
ncbi:MAG: NAD(P)-dependent oxidoreductase [Rhodospirillales bacterium]|nr:NAD(P)-dependent oxidoreductase [Rhodospirillales bacterium]